MSPIGGENRARHRATTRLLAWGLAASLALASGCANSPQKGFYYTLREGETVYRVSKRFRVPPEVLVRVNHIRDVRDVPTGARLWVPRKPAARRAGPRSVSAQPARPPAKPAAVKTRGLAFGWPVKGRLSSRYGRRNGRPHQGIDLAAAKGTPIRAAEAGRVIHAGRLGAYGKVVIVKHAGPYRTVYAHANRIYVRKGQFVERGQKVAEVGATGRATGPHLHFEVRHGATPRDPMQYLRR